MSEFKVSRHALRNAIIALGRERGRPYKANDGVTNENPWVIISIRDGKDYGTVSDPRSEKSIDFKLGAIPNVTMNVKTLGGRLKSLLETFRTDPIIEFSPGDHLASIKEGNGVFKLHCD